MQYGIPFVHQKNARSRSVKIYVKADGTVVVTTPPRFPTAGLPMYVEKARVWIEAQQQKRKEKPQLLTTDHVYYFGVAHGIVVTDHQDGSVHVREGKIYVAPLSHSRTATHAALEKWLKNRAIEYCLPRLEVLADKMRVQYKDVRFKQQKTCWGSCSSDKNLNFNWRLVHAPKAVIDYVLIHELTHTVHMNHGHRFWDMVAAFDPDHPLHRGWLKRFGSTED